MLIILFMIFNKFLDETTVGSTVLYVMVVSCFDWPLVTNSP